MVVSCIRWCRPDVQLADRLDFLSWIVYPLGFYWFWQVTYLIITEVLQRNVIYEEGYMTSLRLLTQEKLHRAMRFMCETLGIKKSNIIMVIWLSLYTTATLAPEDPTVSDNPSLPGCHPVPLCSL